MVEIRRGTEISGAAAGGTAERLPWLEPVEDEDDVAGGYGEQGDPPGGYGGVVAAGLVVLVAIALVTAGVVWFRHHRAATADIGEVIHPDPGPYKVKPTNPGGLAAEDVGSVAAATSAGGDIDSVLDLGAVPEAPVIARPKPGAKARVVAMPAPPAVEPASEPKPAKPAAAAPGASPSGGGAIQLGAFSTEAKARAAWKSLSARFAFLKEMIPVVSAVEAGETRLFRLRADGGAEPAARLCAQLRVAGESCAVIGG